MKKILFSLLLMFPVFSQADNFFLAEIGLGSVNVEEEYLVNDSSSETQTTTLDGGIFLGRKFENKFRAESGLKIGIPADFGASDNSTVDELMVRFGYEINVGERAKVIPKVGYSMWSMVSQEGALFNPGPEEKRRFGGNNIIYGLSVPFRHRSVLNFQAAEYEFGIAGSVTLAIEFKS